MSPAFVVSGGEAAIRAALVEVAATVGLELREADSPQPGEGLVDLGLPPREWPSAEELVTAEAKRANRLAAAGSGARVVRASVFGADSSRGTAWQRAQFAAEEAYRASGADVVVLRRGVLLGPCDITQALRRAVERSRIVPVPGIRDAKLEPIVVDDFARYCVEAAVAPRPLDDVYDVGCGEIITGGLLLRGLADSLGLSRWLVPVPAALGPPFAAALATDEFPASAVRIAFETIARGFLARRMNAWSHFEVRPTDLREGLARATGMVFPVRKRGEGRFAAWRKPEKKGILWRKGK
jgi:uncharacterized protein YbjT (DUF2867 family)